MTLIIVGVPKFAPANIHTQNTSKFLGNAPGLMTDRVIAECKVKFRN